MKEFLMIAAMTYIFTIGFLIMGMPIQMAAITSLIVIAIVLNSLAH